jgi:predicted O-methyltransferase YrrM
MVDKEATRGGPPGADRRPRAEDLRREQERVAAIARTIDGWLSEAQGRALFEAAAATTGRGAIVEIGSWKGRSTAWLAAGARVAGRRVYAIDRHAGSHEDPSAETLDEFLANISRAGVADAVEPLVMSSSEAAALIHGPVELLFVDGDHSYAGAKADAEIWLRRVIDGGIVAFHDVATAGYDGPRRVVRRSICWNVRFDRIRRVGSMLMARRTPHRRTRAAVWGTLAGLLLYVFDLKQLLRSAWHVARST